MNELKNVNVFAATLAAKGIAVNGAAKMPVKQNKPVVTLKSATALVLENLKANKAYWTGETADELDVKQRNYKVIGGIYSIGLKYTIRYCKDVFGDGKAIASFDTREEFVAMYDELIAGVESGMLEESIRGAIAANASMRKAH